MNTFMGITGWMLRYCNTKFANMNCFFLKPFFYLDPSFYITVIVLNMPKMCFSVFSGASPASKRGPWPGSDETDFCVARDWSNVERDGGTLGGCAECVPGTLSQGEGFLKDFWGLLESNYTPWKLTAKAPCLKNGWLEFLIVSFWDGLFFRCELSVSGSALVEIFWMLWIPETLEVCLLTGKSTAGPEAWQISWSLRIWMKMMRMKMMRMRVVCMLHGIRSIRKIHTSSLLDGHNLGNNNKSWSHHKHWTSSTTEL